MTRANALRTVCLFVAFAGCLQAPIVRAQQCQEIVALIFKANQAKRSNITPDQVRKGPAQTPSNTPGTAPGKLSLGRIDAKHLEMLRDTNALLQRTSTQPLPLVICENDEVNAFARRFQGTYLVIVNTGLLELFQYDRDRIAFAIAHEYAHVLRGHLRGRPSNEVRGETIEAVSEGIEYERQTGRKGVAIIRALQVKAGLSAAFSREHEKEADDTGVALLLEAKLNPKGALEATKTLMVTFGNYPTAYYDTHPGWTERLQRLARTVQTEELKTRALQRAGVVRRVDASNIASADTLLEYKRWSELTALVDRWIATTEDSGSAWYYRGRILLDSSNRPLEALSAFQKAYALDALHGDALYLMCRTMLNLGLKFEASNCGRELMGPHLLYSEFQENEFKGRLWAGRFGLSRVPPSNFWITKTPSGSTLITNDKATLRNRGLEENAMPMPADYVPLPWHLRRGRR